MVKSVGLSTGHVASHVGVIDSVSYATRSRGLSRCSTSRGFVGLFPTRTSSVGRRLATFRSSEVLRSGCASEMPAAFRSRFAADVSADLADGGQIGADNVR
jgi:hypothetical protein